MFLLQSSWPCLLLRPLECDGITYAPSDKFATSLLQLVPVLTMYTYVQCISVVSSSSAVAQSCLTLCDPMEYSPPGSSIHGILQARTLEWGAISFSNAWKWKVKVKSLSRLRLVATPWTIAHQAPPSMGFSRQEYWSGVPLPSPHC